MARSGLVYGPTGNLKTTAVKHFSHYIAKLTGKATLLLSADGGGWAPCQPEIDAGMIVAHRIHPLGVPQTLRKVGQGYWPDEASNFHLIDYTRFGGMAVEGWTSIAIALLRYLAEQGIDIGGETRAKLGTFKAPITVDGMAHEERFWSTTRGDYGEMPKQLNSFVLNVGSLPLEYVLHTALDRIGEDDTRQTIGGPDIPGKASLFAAPQWVGDCIHAQDYPVKRMVKVPKPGGAAKEMEDMEVVQNVVRYHYVTHTDPATGIKYHAKPRVTPEKVTALYGKFPGGFFEPTPEHGLDTYLEAVDALNAEQASSDTLKDWRAKMDAKMGRGATAAK